MNLDAAHAYAAIVNVPSVEQSSVQRIQPGDGDHSYLYQKINGAAGIFPQAKHSDPAAPSHAPVRLRQAQPLPLPAGGGAGSAGEGQRSLREILHPIMLK